MIVCSLLRTLIRVQFAQMTNRSLSFAQETDRSQQFAQHF